MHDRRHHELVTPPASLELLQKQFIFWVSSRSVTPLHPLSLAAGLHIECGFALLTPVFFFFFCLTSAFLQRRFYSKSSVQRCLHEGNILRYVVRC